MLKTSVRTLNILAAIVWYFGAAALTVKGFSLLMKAGFIYPGGLAWRLTALLGIALGVLKAAKLFNRACRNNLKRIAALSEPKIWNFYRLWFILLLIVLIYSGALLSHAAEGNYIFLLLMALLDISIGVALLGSSYVFWVKKTY